MTQNYATNHGANYTVCYLGPVVHPGGGGGPAGAPAPWAVDVQLTTPFLYDPAQGDLAIDVDYPGGANFVGGSLPDMDVQLSNSRSSRVFSSAQYPAADGTTLSHGVCVEVTYVVAGPNTATTAVYGAGCYDQFASAYEVFAMNSFDLANSDVTLVSTGAGYIMVPAGTGWYTPTSPPLGLGNNVVSVPQALGFSLPYPGGSTTAIHISSNGFIWAHPNTDSGCCNGDAMALLAGSPRWCPMWTDFNPPAGGSIHFDIDPTIAAAYVTYVGVVEYGMASTSTFQVAFFASGQVEFRYQQCAVSNHDTLVGWSPGIGARDRGNMDLSVAMPVVTLPDSYPLYLVSGSRPIINTSVTMTSGNVPAGSPIGAFVGGVSKLSTGIDLGNIGMPGCRQYSSQEAAIAFIPNNGIGSYVLSVPNDPTLAGTHIYMQASAMSVGVNPLGVLSSNGLDLMVGTQ